jgi:PST family polysaccharide transporter
MLKVLVAIGALQVVTMLFQLVRTKVLALLLGPELVGAMGVIDKLLAVIVQTCSLSLPFAALRFLPERWSRGPAEFGHLFRRMRNVQLLLVLPVTLGALAVTALRPEVWGVQLLPYREPLAAAIFTLPVLGLVPLFQNALAGRLEHHRAMVAALLHAVVVALAAAGVWWAGLAGYYLAYAVLGLLLVVLLGRVVLRGTAGARETEPARRGAGARLSLPLPVVRFSAALVVLTFAAPYAALFIQYRLLRYHGAEVAGWMQAAFGVGLAVRAVLGSAHPVFLTPNVNRGGSPSERMEWANRFQITFCFLAAVVVPPVLLFPELFVRLLYSSSFLPAAPFAQLFVLTEVGLLLGGTYQSLVIAMDRMGFHVAYNVAGQLLVIAAASALVRPFGLLGAGLAGMMAPAVTLLATTLFLQRVYGLRLPGRVVWLSASLVAALLAAGLAGALVSGAAWQGLVIRLAVYLLIMGWFAVLLTPDERSRLRRLAGDLRGRFFPAPA